MPDLQIVPRQEENAKLGLPDGAEAYQTSVLQAQLGASAALCIIANALNSLERQRDGLPLCRLMDRELPDRRRLIAKAKAIVRSVETDIEDFAVDEVAHVMCDGMDGEYSKLEDQPPTVQIRYARWARTAVNAYWAALEGRNK